MYQMLMFCREHLVSLHMLQITLIFSFTTGFPGISAGKESACNAGDPGSIPGLRGSPGEGISYPLQYSWASLVVQLGSITGLGRSPGEGNVYPLQYSSLEFHELYLRGHNESDRTERLSLFFFSLTKKDYPWFLFFFQILVLTLHT